MGSRELKSLVVSLAWLLEVLPVPGCWDLACALLQGQASLAFTLSLITSHGVWTLPCPPSVSPCSAFLTVLCGLCSAATRSPSGSRVFLLSPRPPRQKYIAQVLQDSSPEGEATESEEQGSQDEELINADGMNDTDFQSCEDSLIENEIHQ